MFSVSYLKQMKFEMLLYKVLYKQFCFCHVSYRGLACLVRIGFSLQINLFSHLLLRLQNSGGFMLHGFQCLKLQGCGAIFRKTNGGISVISG